MISERRRLLRGTGWTLSSTVVAVIVGTVVNPVLVLYLGVPGYGIWASAVALGSLFGLAGDLGVSGALTKFISEREGTKEPVGSFTASALVFGTLAGGATGLGLAAIALVFHDYGGYTDFGLLLSLQALQMPFAMGSASLAGIFQGRRQFRQLALLTMFQSVLGLVLLILLLVGGQGLVGVMLASTLSSVIFFCTLLALNRKGIPLPAIAAIRRDFRKLIPFGIQLTATNALSTVLYQIDVVILAFVTNNPMLVGTYALAVFVTRTFWIIPGSISTTTYPVTSQYAATNDWGRVSRYLSTAFIASVAIMGVLASGLILFGRPVLRVVFGPDSLGAYEISLILLAGTGALGSLRSIASSMPGVGRPDIGLRISAIGAVSLAFLALVLTEVAGVLGTALAVTICFGLVAILLLRAIDRHVLRDNGTPLLSKRALTTAVVAVLGAGICLIAGLPDAPAAAAIGGAGLLWGAIAASLGIASGGRKTWGDVLHLPGGTLAERD